MFYKQRILSLVREDLTWWYTLLPDYNGKTFFIDNLRLEVHLYTDASGKGIGGFFLTGPQGRD
jgi:hypothetical protein